MPKLTLGGKKTAVAAVESKFSKEYGKGDPRVFATLNKVGLMRGSKATAKGRRAAKTR